MRLLLLCACAVFAAACAPPSQEPMQTQSGTAAWRVTSGGGTGGTVHAIDTGTACLYVLVGDSAGIAALPKAEVGTCVSNER